jgi:hypothetical protein
VISSEWWAHAQNDLEAEENRGTNKKRKKLGHALIHFRYSLQGRKFVDCSVERVSNLFLVYATAQGENVSNDYLALQVDDEEDDTKRTSYSHNVDPLRLAILRQGIRLPDLGTYHLFGCSNSQIQKHHYIFRLANSQRYYPSLGL